MLEQITADNAVPRLRREIERKLFGIANQNPVQMAACPLGRFAVPLHPDDFDRLTLFEALGPSRPPRSPCRALAWTRGE